LFSRLLAALTVNLRTVVFLIGLVLLASGLALVSTAAALIAPGLILMWLALPPSAKPRKAS
jgi:hypothetical protein